MAIDWTPVISGVSSGAIIGLAWLFRELRFRRNNKANNSPKTNKDDDCPEGELRQINQGINELNTNIKLLTQFVTSQFRLILRTLNGK